MKIVLTGSLGNIGRPLTENLVKDGFDVTVISSNPERQNTIESLGAKAATGSIYDAGFLTETFLSMYPSSSCALWDFISTSSPL